MSLCNLLPSNIYNLMSSVNSLSCYLPRTSFVSSLSTDASDRWTLPSQAVDALVDCLREENDEIVKHYAAKVRDCFDLGVLSF